jgi:outer membrane protein assembly factor BamB
MRRAWQLVFGVALCTAAAGAAQSGTAGQGHWPQWRGPALNGVAPGDAPLQWSDASNVAWKVEIPGRGFSSPIVWGDKLFLTTAVPTGKPATSSEGGPGPGGNAGVGEHRFVVMAVDRRSGKTLWEQTATTATPHEGYHRTYGSFASNNSATDGQRVYAFFGSRGLFAYDMNGTLLWTRDFNQKMKMRLQFGEGSAVVLHEGKLITVFDHQEQGLLAVTDAATGKEVWSTPRNEGSSWSTPAVVTHQGKTQIVVTSTPKAMGFDLETGKVAWEVSGLGSNPIPMPVQSGDLVLVMSGHREPKLMAVRLGRTGDLTGTDAIAWEATRGLSYTPSPVLHDGILYMLTDNGQLSALDTKTGTPHYQQQRLPKPYNFKASPVAANGRLYLASEEEDVIVVKMGPSYEVLATNRLADQSFIATPVIAAGDLYLRSRTHLFRITGSAASTE